MTPHQKRALAFAVAGVILILALVSFCQSPRTWPCGPAETADEECLHFNDRR